jgi:hypothetical protein
MKKIKYSRRIKNKSLRNLGVKRGFLQNHPNFFWQMGATVCGLALCVFLVKANALAGIMAPGSTPAPGGFTLNDIYNRLSTNATANENDHAFAPVSSPASTFYTLNDIYNAIPTINANKVLTNTTYLGVAGAYNIANLTAGMVKLGITYGTSSTGTLIPAGGTAKTSNVLKGKTFFGAGQADWTPQTGSYDIDNLTAEMVKFGITYGTSSTGSLVPSGGTAAAANVCNGSTFFGASQTDWTPETGVLNPSASTIMSGTTICGVPGTALANPAYGDNVAAKVLNTAANPGTYDPNTCSTVYDTTNLSVGTVKSGTAFGNGSIGAYPSASYPLFGAVGTDAAAGNILSGFDAWDRTGAHIVGLIPTRTLSADSETLSAGYYNATTLSAVDTDLISNNIRSGISIFGISGNSNVVNTSAGTAGTGDILSGKIAYVGGSQITGAMANKVGSATTITPSTADQAIAQGYYGGAIGDGKVSGDANLISANIKSTITIFGVSGSSKVLDTTSGTAANGDLLSGKIAFANGAQINGSMANIGQQKINPGTASTTITAGYHNGTGYCNGDANLVGTNIKSGVSIFDVPGNLVAGYLYGSSSASQVLTSAGAGAGTYNATTLSAGTVKSGTAFGNGSIGAYPSASYPLPGAVPATDLAASGGNITSANGSVEWYTSDGTQQTATLNFPALASVCANATSNNSNGTLNPSAISIGAGNTICGISGTLLKNEYNGSAGSAVSNYAWYPLNNFGALVGNSTVAGFYGGVDDYNNTTATLPAGSYIGAGWYGAKLACSTGTYCGAGAHADNKDLNTGLVWSTNMTAGSWFVANNCYAPGTPTYNPGDCTSTDLTGCGCVKLPSSQTGCEALDGGGIWRTPTQKELMQVYIDGSWQYLSSATTNFWSATTGSNYTYYGWYVNLANGSTSYYNKTTNYTIRCVH